MAHVSSWKLLRAMNSESTQSPGSYTTIIHMFYYPLQCTGRLYTSESDVYMRQRPTYKDGSRAKRVKWLITYMADLAFMFYFKKKC